MHDLVIRNVLIVPGTGTQTLPGNAAIDGMTASDKREMRHRLVVLRRSQCQVL